MKVAIYLGVVAIIATTLVHYPAVKTTRRTFIRRRTLYL